MAATSMAALAAGAGEARAACSTTLTQPPDGAVQTASPTFRWSGVDCSSYRVWYSPSGAFGADRTVTPWRTSTQYRMQEGTWDGHLATDWADGVYWKVQGRAADGSLAFTAATWFVPVDPDLDDDGVSQGEGDCDDEDPAAFPGAAEVCGDGVDQDCDGADAACLGVPGVGDLVITEALVNPGNAPDYQGEWFEVWNAGTEALDLYGLQFADLGVDSFFVDANVVLAPGEYAVLARSGDPALNTGVEPDYVYGGQLPLANTGDEIYLIGADGVVIDAVEYDPDTFPIASGLSMTLDRDLLDAASNDSGDSWCLASSHYGVGELGTPGAANDDCP